MFYIMKVDVLSTSLTVFVLKQTLEDVEIQLDIYLRYVFKRRCRTLKQSHIFIMLLTLNQYSTLHSHAYTQRGGEVLACFTFNFREMSTTILNVFNILKTANSCVFYLSLVVMLVSTNRVSLQ